MRSAARAPRWLLAPDSFKGTLSASSVATALADGVRQGGGGPDECPVADGGEGTLAVLLGSLGGTVVTHDARDPLGRTVRAAFALLDDGATAVVETAEASGLGRVASRERDAERATSAGTGDLIAEAAARGARRILVGVGGSACTDGGVGAIAAIEARGGLAGVAVEVLCDSTTPFEDAARVFAPQKGADRAAVVRLSGRLQRVAVTFPRDPRGVPRSGCAGGLSGALWARFGARLHSGADAVLDVVGFDARAAAAGRVITGEGRLDAQSVDGKLVGVVARRARAAGATVCAVVGECALPDPALLGLESVIEAQNVTEISAAAKAIVQTFVDSSGGSMQSCA